MTTYEIMSIVSTSCTALIAFSAILIPLIMKHSTNKTKLKIQKNELHFNHYQRTIDRFAIAYGEWKHDTTKKQNLIRIIYHSMTFCKPRIRERLSKLVELVQAENTSKKTEEIFYNCFDWLQFSIGATNKQPKFYL